MTMGAPASGADKASKSVLPAAFCRFCRAGWQLCGTSLRLSLRVLVVLYFLFCALVLVLRYAVLPNVESYKPELEQLVSRSVGRQLAIGSLRASWQGLNPRLVLENVVLRDRQGQAALSLPHVSATLSWWTLAAGDLRFDRIDIDQPALELRREADGKLYVGGFFIDPQQAGEGKGLDWVLAQHQIVVRKGVLRWNDELRQAAGLTLPDVELVLKNRWRHHQFALKATPPAGLAAPLDVRGDFQHPVFAKKISDFSAWSGELYADMRQADLPAFKAYFDYPADLQAGHGTVRSWLRLDHGRVVDVTADVRLSDVLGKLGKDLPELDLRQISGRLVASEKAATGRKYLPSWFGKVGHSIALIDFSMQARDGAVLPATTIRENFFPGEKGQPEKVELYAKLLDLQTLANFSLHLPLPDDQRQMLADFSPKGQLRDFSAKWQGQYPEISSYSLKGQFVNLSLKPQAAQLARAKTASLPARAAVPAIPGFENLSGSIDASDKGGSFSLDSTDLSLRLSSYFVDPLMPFSRLQMQARWQFEKQDKLMFQVNRMDAQQDGMRASFSGKHVISMRQTGEGQPGEVDISGRISGFDLKQLDRFIPTAATPELRHWLTRSILGGRADDVAVRIKGDLAQFPFVAGEDRRAPKGEFVVKGKLSGGKLDFTAGELAEGGKAPLWPLIDNIKGSFIFERARMEINGDTARTAGVDLRKVRAVIPDLASSDAVLDIDGLASGNLQGMLNYVNASPVSGWLGNFLQESKALAGAGLTLKLQLPLNRMDDSKVHGALQFGGNEVVLLNGLPPVSVLNGKLEFNERGVSLGTLKGNLLGGAVAISGGSQKDGSVRVRLDGLATAEGLRKAIPASIGDRLAERLGGSTRYTAGIHVRKRQPEIIVESGLQGLTLNLPAPLRKSAGESLPLRFEMLPLASPEQGIMRDEIRVALGSAINARYLRQKSGEKNGAWQVLRGGIGINATVPEPDSGLNANVNVKSLNVDEWRRLAGPASAGGVAAGAAAGVPDLSSYLEPDVVAARTDALHIMGKKLDNVVVGASHQKGSWQANIDSTQASGHLSWSEATPGGQGNVSARLSRLIIPQSAASDVSDLLEGKSANTQIPGLDIVAENFELFNKKFGRMELQASNQATAAGREWQIGKVSLKNPDAELRGSGKWVSRNGEGNTQLNYVLEVASAGQLLERLGFANVLRGGRGKLEGEISWNGLPFAMDIPSMTGQLRLELAAGQFLKVDPGAAKLLGVLSLQSLPRRLTLDFRDVFSDGFAFDSITGSAQIQHGVARTGNLKMRSVNATVLLDGSADLAHESQNLHVAVIPEVNAGTASVVYGLAVNPVIGLGTFLAQLFLREPLARAFTFEYQVTGPWKDPTVTKLEHRDAKGAATKPESKKENE